MSAVHDEIHDLLAELEAALRRNELWHWERPSVEALASRQPFCVDTLTFPQWLQFIFIERMYALIDARQPLPEDCGIAPMAEEYFKYSDKDGTEVIACLYQVDKRLVNGHGIG